MANLVVKNGFNGIHGNKKGPAVNNKRTLSGKHLPPLDGIDKIKHEGEAFQSYRETRSTNLLHRPTSDFNSSTDEYLILLHEDVKEIRQLALSLGITRRIQAVDKYGEDTGGVYQHKRTMPRRLPTLDKPVCFGKQSIKWTKHQNDDAKDVNTFPVYESLDSIKSAVDIAELPSAVKRRLKPVDIPQLGVKYRLPAMTKPRQKTNN